MSDEGVKEGVARFDPEDHRIVTESGSVYPSKARAEVNWQASSESAYRGGVGVFSARPPK